MKTIIFLFWVSLSALASANVYALHCPEPADIKWVNNTWSAPEGWLVNTFTSNKEIKRFQHANWVQTQHLKLYAPHIPTGLMSCNYKLEDGGHLQLMHQDVQGLPTGKYWVPFIQKFPLIHRVAYSCYESDSTRCEI